MFSTRSFYTIDTSNSTRTFAKTGNDGSYKYYNNITWSMWGMWAPGSSTKDIFGMYEDVSSNARSWLFSVNSDGTFRIVGSSNGSSTCNLKSSTAVIDMGWHHFVVTFASGTFTLYVDGVQQTLTPVANWPGGTSLYSAGIPLMIANKNPTSGGIDDDSPAGCYSNFSMWNKVLSSSEITAIYNSGEPGDLTQHSAYANLTNWWRMDQTDSAPTLSDSRASGASATISTAQAWTALSWNNFSGGGILTPGSNGSIQKTSGTPQTWDTCSWSNKTFSNVPVSLRFKVSSGIFSCGFAQQGRNNLNNNSFQFNEVWTVGQFEAPEAFGHLAVFDNLSPSFTNTAYVQNSTDYIYMNVDSSGSVTLVYQNQVLWNYSANATNTIMIPFVSIWDLNMQITESAYSIARTGIFAQSPNVPEAPSLPSIDPGVENVLVGTEYEINGNFLVGTMQNAGVTNNFSQAVLASGQNTSGILVEG